MHGYAAVFTGVSLPIVKAGGVWRKNISGFFEKPIDKRGRICYNIIRRQDISPHRENADESHAEVAELADAHV